VSIRLRVALVFTLALAIAFAIGSWLLISQLHAQLLKAQDATVKAQLAPFKSAGSVSSASRITVPENWVAQIIGPSGQVLGHRGDAGTTPLLSRKQLGLARTTGLTNRFEDEQYRFFAAPIANHQAVALVGRSLEDQAVSGPLSAQTTAVIIGGVVFVLLGGLGAYWLAAAALSPVERMRREVASLSTGDSAVGVQVPRTRDELAALAGTMNELLARLHEALAKQRDFVADASHELRTPLAVLGAELELAGRPGRSQQDLAEAVASAEEEVARLTRLTNDLLLLARSDEGTLPVRPAPTLIREMLDRSAERVSARAAEAGVSFEVNAPRGLVASVDEDRLRQAVDNLIDNALRFAPRDTRIVVSGTRSETLLIIEVADAGPGFPTEFLPHAFERFRRPDTVRARSDGGAGLGLAIVAAVAAAHGGRASARNGPHGGAVVRLELPARANTDPPGRRA
jgi:two-component system, OmpR family, sensor kinase